MRVRRRRLVFRATKKMALLQQPQNRWWKHILWIKPLWVYLFIAVGSGVLAIPPASAEESDDRAPIEVTTLIKASPQKVWKAIIDFAHYSSWNTWVVRIEGEASVGSTVRAYDASGKSLALQITSIDAPLEICWVDVTWFTHLGMGGWRCRKIVPLPDNQGVVFINHFEYTGLFAGALDHMTREYLESGMQIENDVLKKHVENN